MRSGTPRELGPQAQEIPGATGTKTCWRLAEDAWARHIAIGSLGRSTRSIGPTDHVGGSHRARFFLLFTILPLDALALVLWLVVDADEALHPL